MKYPSDLPAKTRSRTPSAVGESREGGVTPTKTPVEQQPPIGISLHLPPDVMFLEEPQIAVWDKNGEFQSCLVDVLLHDINYIDVAEIIYILHESFDKNLLE